MVQSIVCNHGRFNATPFIESFEQKCSWKLSKLTESAYIGCEWTVSTPRVFHLDFEGDVRDSDLSSWKIMYSFQLVWIVCVDIDVTGRSIPTSWKLLDMVKLFNVHQ